MVLMSLMLAVYVEKVKESIAPKGFTAYSQSEMLEITDGPEWLQIEE
jgi:hypothetical protein